MWIYVFLFQAAAVLVWLCFLLKCHRTGFKILPTASTERKEEGGGAMEGKDTGEREVENRKKWEEEKEEAWWRRGAWRKIGGSDGGVCGHWTLNIPCRLSPRDRERKVLQMSQPQQKMWKLISFLFRF